MGGKIEAYIDVASVYSYLAFAELMRTKESLEKHGVKIELHPVFLGAIHAGSGNKPPIAVPAKAAYLQHDSPRSAVDVGKPEIRGPKDLMAMGMTVLPLRALWFIKTRHPEHTYHTAFHYLYHCFWTPPNRNLTDEAVLREVLAEAPVGSPTELGSPIETLFGPDEVVRIVEGARTDAAKKAVKASTQEALDRGAFGAPWFWVTDDEGRSAPFFGHDRFQHVYRFLGVPFRGVELLPPGSESGSSGKEGKGAKL